MPIDLPARPSHITSYKFTFTSAAKSAAMYSTSTSNSSSTSKKQKTKTRGQRPNESQKAVIIDMMGNSLPDMNSSFVFYPFWGKFDLWSRSSALRSLNAPYWIVTWYQV